MKNLDANAFNRAWGNASYSANYNAALDYNDDGKYTNIDANAFGRAFNTQYHVTTTLPFVLNGLGSIPNQTTEIGVQVDLQVPFGNPNGEAVTYVLDSALPPGLTLTPDGLIEGAPLATGSFPVTISASDTDYPSGSPPVNFTWTVTSVQIGNQVTTLGTAVSLQVPFTNPYGDTPYFTADGLPLGLSINSSTGLITGVANTLTDNIPADDTVNIYSQTSAGEQLASFQWVVIGVPSIAVPGSQSTAPGTPLVFQSSNGNAITFADSNDTGTTATILTVNLSVSNGTLTLGSTPGLTTFTGLTDNGTDAVSFMADAADATSALSGLTYTPSLSAIGPDALQITADDPDTLALDGANEVLQVVDIAVGPTVSVPAAQATPAGTALTFSSAAGNNITVADSGSGANVTVALSVANGTLLLNPLYTSDLSSPSGNGSGSVTFTSTVAYANDALSGLAYTPATNFLSDDILNVSVNDPATTCPISRNDCHILT